MKRIHLRLLVCLTICIGMLSGCAGGQSGGNNMRNIEITVNEETFSATLNDNEAARAFAKMLPLTLNWKN